MSEKQRELPSWMLKKDQVNEKEPPPSLLLSRKKRKVARSVFYCMNETELVEAAVSYLTRGVCDDVAPLTDHKVDGKTEDTSVNLIEKSAFSRTKAKSVDLEESSDCSAAQEASCVSETDLDITEVETLPYTKSQQQPIPEGQRSGPVQDHIDIELEAEKRENGSQMPTEEKEEYDDMRLVREIFFTR